MANLGRHFKLRKSNDMKTFLQEGFFFLSVSEHHVLNMI